MSVYALLTLVMLMVQDPDWGLGHGVVAAGCLLTPYAAFSVTGARIADWFSRRADVAFLLPVGYLVFASASALVAFAHTNGWQVVLCMSLAGLGSGFTFSSMAVLMVPHVPSSETSSAMAFNQVLRFLGFSGGSALGAALMVSFGGGAQGFRETLLVTSGLWVICGLANGAVGLRARRIRHQVTIGSAVAGVGPASLEGYPASA